MVEDQYGRYRHDIDRDADHGGRSESVVGIEHRREDAAQTYRDDAWHQPTRHTNGDAHLRRWEAVGDDRNVPACREVSDDRASGQHDSQQIEHGTAQTPGFVFLTVREIFGERWNER